MCVNGNVSKSQRDRVQKIKPFLLPFIRLNQYTAA
jgi:hypothetical protein